MLFRSDEVAAVDRPGGYAADDGQQGSEGAEEEEGKLWTGKARVETFVVGQDLVGKGERVQWIVEGGKYKASFLLDGGGEAEQGEQVGCLISETVVPGFEFEDHDFMKRERAEALLTVEQVEEMGWMLRKD